VIHAAGCPLRGGRGTDLCRLQKRPTKKIKIQNECISFFPAIFSRAYLKVEANIGACPVRGNSELPPVHQEPGTHASTQLSVTHRVETSRYLEHTSHRAMEAETWNKLDQSENMLHINIGEQFLGKLETQLTRTWNNRQIRLPSSKLEFLLTKIWNAHLTTTSNTFPT
jgi:hypothetical protein